MKPVLTVDSVGDKFWYLNDKLHREDGPAVEYANGTKFWYLNGELHREDGPAVEYADGDREWWVNGTKIAKSIKDRKVRMKINYQTISGTQEELIFDSVSKFKKAAREVLQKNVYKGKLLKYRYVYVGYTECMRYNSVLYELESQKEI